MPLPSAEPAMPEYMSVRLVSQIHAQGISLAGVTSTVSTDDTLQQVIRFVEHGWPKKSKITDAIHTYYYMHSELKFLDGQLVRGGRLVIPSKLQQRILQLAHTGHPGMVRMKCGLRQVY